MQHSTANYIHCSRIPLLLFKFIFLLVWLYESQTIQQYSRSVGVCVLFGQDIICNSHCAVVVTCACELFIFSLSCFEQQNLNAFLMLYRNKGSGSLYTRMLSAQEGWSTCFLCPLIPTLVFCEYSPPTECCLPCPCLEQLWRVLAMVCVWKCLLAAHVV